MYIGILFFIMVSAGLFGGLINYVFAFARVTTAASADEPAPPPRDWTPVLVAFAVIAAPAIALYFWMPSGRYWIAGVTLLGIVLIPAVSHLIKQPTSPTTPTADMTRSVVSGIGAAFLVPLFLNLTSSNLIDKIRGNPGTTTPVPADEALYFVFTGLCLLASISSTAFISSLSDKVLAQVARAEAKSTEAADHARSAEKKAESAGIKADKVAEGVKPLVEAASEKDIPAGRQKRVRESGVEGEALDANPEPAPPTRAQIIQKGTDRGLSAAAAVALAAMLAGDKPYRSMGGVGAESGLDATMVSSAVEELQSKGLIGQVQVSEGSRWYATNVGRRLLS